MEPNPPYLQHNHRYVPYSPNPPTTTLVPNSPNFYGSHLHLPPPPPPSRHPLPAPPPPPPNIPYQFTFRPNPNYPIEGTPPHTRSTMNNHHPDVAHSSRLSYGVPVADGRPYDPNRYHHRYADSDPSWDGRAYPVGILDPEPRPLQFNQRPVSPYRPIEKIRHDFEGDVRFRDGFQRNPRRGDFMRDRGDRNSHFDSSSRGWSEHGAASSRAYQGNYDNRSHYRDSTENENHRWPHTKEFVREGDGVQKTLGKHEYYSSELERHNNKGSREVNYEFDHTPRKQMQKKSALLRIQKPKPSYRNREDEVSHYSGYFNDTTSSSFRGMEQLKYIDHGVEENTIEGSPVELDVSFKSNSLVAKAIVPPLSSAVVTAKNLTPRNSKIRKLEASEKDCSSSQVLKPSESMVKLDGALCAGKFTSTSNPVANFGIDNGHKSSSEPPSHEVDVSLGKRKVERSAKVMSSGSSGKTNSTMVAKKKKIVKKVVKKVLNPWSRLSSSQPKEKLDGPVGMDTFTHCQLTTSVPENLSTPSGENTTPAGIVSVHHTEWQPCPNYVSVCACERMDGSPKTSVPEEVGGDAHCGGLNLQKFKRKWNDLTPSLDSSKDKHIKFDESSTNADNLVHGLQTLSNTDKDCIELQSEKMPFFRVEGFSKQGCQNESSILVDGIPAVVSSEVMLSVGSGIEKNMTQERLMNTSSGCHELNSAVVIDRSSINSLERSVYTDFENVESDSYQSGTCQIDKIDDDGTLEGFQKTASSAGDMLALKILEETRIGDCKMATECSDQATSTIYSFTTRSSCFRSEEANLETGDDIGEQPYQGGITMLCESGATVSSVDDTILAEVSEELTPNDNREVGSPRLDLLSSGMNNLHVAPLNAVSSQPCVDTNLSSSFKEPDFTISHGPSIELVLKCCADGFGVTQGSSSIDGLLEAKISASNEVNVGLDEVSTKNEDDNIFSAGYMVPSSPITSAINEEPLDDSSTSLVEVPTEIIESSIQPVEVVAVSSTDTVCTAGFSPCQEAIIVGGSSKGVNSAGDNFVNDSWKFDGSNVYSCCTTENFGIANMKSICPSGMGWERVASVASAGSNHDIDIMSVENDEGGKTNLDAGDGQLMICGKSAQIRKPSERHCLAVNQRSPQTELRDDSYLHHERELPSIFNHPSLLAHDNRVSTPNCDEEPMETVPEISEGCSPVLMNEPDSTHGQIDKNNIGQDDTTPDKNSAIRGGSDLSNQTSNSIETKIDSKRNRVMEKNQHTNGRALPSQDSHITTPHIQYPLSAESHGRKIHSIHAPPRIPGYSSFPHNASRSTTSSTHGTQPRTWRRTTTSASPLPKNKPISSTVPPQRQLPRRSSELLNNSYIRKGNSLVRKSPPVTLQSRGSLGLSSYVYQLDSLGTDEVKKTSGSESRVDGTDTSSSLGTGAVSASFERPRTPPLPCITKIPNRPTTSSGGRTSSPLAETSNVSNETTSLKFAESSDELSAIKESSKISAIPVYFTGSTNSVSSQNESSDGNLTSLNAKSITYVKKKSNQLIATSNTTGPCVHIADNTVAASSDGYYKRSRNQLIRTPLEGHAKQTVAMPDSAIISNGLTNSVVLPGRSFGRRRNQKVVTNAGKSSKFSLVWTLHGAQLSKKNGSSLKCQVLPHLPWKRVKYSRSFMQSPVSISNNSSLSTIRKLLMLRNRNTVYTRSRNGYSLRKFKVLSVGGCNLKWSKSIDRNSKKANEEATLAVAAVERKKREQNGDVCTVSRTNNRSHSSRERIFRIGSLRYKMDSSRRTLQRISDNESSCSMALQTENTMKRPYVPRRLVIGNDEYVRIGNGNQLIRNPKRRTRVLASEKVRWSLHTVRSRLAKKRKYCQFFTRFGRCNKDDGKCPYIHDASKIAVCTKFLNGLCHNSNCKLTHKVIPERMPDCSYFLQGLCTIKSCPYRHVHVNPNAPTCEGFLRGYCAEGNECRKKHSYVCPSFEATGSCPLGSKCKLHHPKNRNKGKKGKRSIEQKNARGRYFGSMRIIDISDRGKAAFEMQSVQDGDDVPLEGKFADFISIDDSDEDGECNGATTERIASSGSGPSELQTDDLDELIKPIGIMKKNLTS
ncbi:uncharacterized protein LOC119993287 isoform X2 [Tripterygium wilfordii]|uniref:uncharacterized protein LOC119993287 isoform X2 n=1 Tax=Tripterygium wilfordii TaxID=458696 RepID=UPI0018F7EA20|nr:uncharacterized protein LOC119993287 isoform X2 [Tripterygium wilfordii]